MTRSTSFVWFQTADKLESEKRNRAEADKERRKLESDLRLCQENVEELDRIKHDLEDNIKRQVKNIAN